MGGSDRQRAHLGEVVPQDLQGAAADDDALVGLGDHELLQCGVVRHGVLADQHPAGGERLDQRPDGRHIGGSGGTHADLAHRPIIAGGLPIQVHPFAADRRT